MATISNKQKLEALRELNKRKKVFLYMLLLINNHKKSKDLF